VRLRSDIFVVVQQIPLSECAIAKNDIPFPWRREW